MKKRILALLAAAAMTTSMLFSFSAGAEEVTPPEGYPEKNIQVIVPFGAGGNTEDRKSVV